MALKTLSDLFRHRLSVIHNAQTQLLEIWPLLEEQAGADELKALFASFPAATKKELEVLDTIFEKLAIERDSTQSTGVRGMIDEARALIEEESDRTVRDAALIEIVQQIEHYEMAIYGSVRSWAREVGESRIATVLQESLNAQGDLDKRLTALAEGGLLKEGINAQTPKQVVTHK